MRIRFRIRNTAPVILFHPGLCGTGCPATSLPGPVGAWPCTAADAEPGSPRSCGRPPGSSPGGLAPTKQVSFSDPAGFFAFFSSTATRRSRNCFPTRLGFCTPGTGGAFTASTNAVPVPSTGTTNRHCQRGWTSDLFSFQSRPELSGSPVESCLRPPGDGQTSQPCTVPVYKLLCNC
jgi:hypothetical protein